MPSFSNTLEQAIHAALALANARRHELATLEHLLLAHGSILDLLDRLAPARQLLTLTRMPAADPQLAAATVAGSRENTRPAWLNHLLKT